MKARIVLIAAALAALPAAAQTGRVESEIKRLAAPIGGEVGVAAWRLDGKGPKILVDADDRFPMASTFKVAVAGALLDKVDKGAASLADMKRVEPSMMIESEILADRFIHPGLEISLFNLMELMLTQSDNTATDLVMAAAGGGDGVTGWLKRQKIEGQTVNRDTAGLLRDFFEIGPGPFADALAAARKQDPAIEKRGAHPKPSFDDDPRDSSTPRAMAELLGRIFRGEALSADSTKILTGMMERCRTGVNRLRGRLPPGSAVADKTGTIGGSVNDVGVLTLPDDAGRVIIAVFIKKSDVPFAEREKVIAEIARSVRDFYLFSAAS